MAVLVHLATGTPFALFAHSLVGRSRNAQVRSASTRTSGEHALIEWADDRWEVRDLGSRNGTSIDGRPLLAGATVRLTDGATLCFGNRNDPWRLASAAPPTPLAAHGSDWVEGDGGWLGFPDPDAPEVVVEAGRRGWYIGNETVEDGQIVKAGGRSWTLFLPEAPLARCRPTTPSEAAP